MNIRILVADDHVIVRQGFKAMLQRDGFEIVGEAADGREAVQQAQLLRPDVAILDLAMPSLNGIDAAKEILKVAPGTRPILLTMFAERHQVLAALRAGITGYLLKTRAVEDLEQAIREVCEGGVYISNGIGRDVLREFIANRDAPSDPLTSREREVVQLVAEGKSTKEVASVLGISVKTAESHRAHVMRKLGIHEAAGLVRYAIRQGLVEP
jgi:DNA-binding NarL/FixJ family response regulator